ncbi:hypothetical protein Tco_0200130 [Tanacetum coccineum]
MISILVTPRIFALAGCDTTCVVPYTNLCTKAQKDARMLTLKIDLHLTIIVELDPTIGIIRALQRGENKQGSILSEVTGFEARNLRVVGSCKMNEFESDVVVVSVKDRVKSVEHHVSKKVGVKGLCDTITAGIEARDFGQNNIELPYSQEDCDKCHYRKVFVKVVLKQIIYTLWALRMKKILMANGVWDLVEGTSTSKEIDVKKDSSASSYLFQGLPEDLQMQVAGCETANEIWDSLKARFIGDKRTSNWHTASTKI